jgi:hypothetical protein
MIQNWTTPLYTSGPPRAQHEPWSATGVERAAATGVERAAAPGVERAAAPGVERAAARFRDYTTCSITPESRHSRLPRCAFGPQKDTVRTSHVVS